LVKCYEGKMRNSSLHQEEVGGRFCPGNGEGCDHEKTHKSGDKRRSFKKEKGGGED